MYIIEVWDKGKWAELPTTLKNNKKELTKEVEDLNELVPKEVLRLLPVSKRYRVKKVKAKHSVN